jgi:uncharacterized protein
MISAVLDTNVLVSALLRDVGPPALILRRVLAQAFRCYLSEAILAEYDIAIRRPHLKIVPSDASEAIRRLRDVSTLVTPRRRVRAAVDLSDNKFLECALEARADFVVTGNLRHFPSRFQDIRILSPTDFMTIVTSGIN